MDQAQGLTRRFLSTPIGCSRPRVSLVVQDVIPPLRSSQHPAARQIEIAAACVTWLWERADH